MEGGLAFQGDLHSFHTGTPEAKTSIINNTIDNLWYDANRKYILLFYYTSDSLTLNVYPDYFKEKAVNLPNQHSPLDWDSQSLYTAAILENGGPNLGTEIDCFHSQSSKSTHGPPEGAPIRGLIRKQF